MPQISQTFGNVVAAHLPMITFLSAIVSFLSFRIRSRASLELEVIALRHQLAVLKRRRPGRARFFLADRLLWIWLYRIRPQAINAMVLVKPTTVMQWHRGGFRFAWRWRSGALRPGRPNPTFSTGGELGLARPINGGPRAKGLHYTAGAFARTTRPAAVIRGGGCGGSSSLSCLTRSFWSTFNSV